MIFKNLSMNDAFKQMDIWKKSDGEFTEIENEYLGLRNDLIKLYNSINTEKLYTLDLEFGIGLFQILKDNGFTPRDSANDGWWRYISLCIIPDIVSMRWGKTADNRFYKQSNRIWLKTIWWYVYLGWQGSIEKTRACLESNNTDQILQVVDRAGKRGYHAALFRKILFYFAESKKYTNYNAADYFRNVMKLHTAYSASIEPDLYDGGIDAYVRMLYDTLDIKYC